MVYLVSLRNYTFTFIKTFFFVCIMLLVYLIIEIISLKSTGSASVFTESLKNYGLLLIKALPFTVLFSSCLYFSSIGMEKSFIITMVPLVAVFNTIIILLCFWMNGDFHEFNSQYQFYYYPEIKEGGITAIGDYQIAVTGGRKGILFYKNAYLFNDFRTGQNDITVNTYQAAGNTSVYSAYNSFTIPYKTPVLKLRETGITYFVMKNFIDYVKYSQNIFNITFNGGSIIYSIISFLFMNLGFFAVVCGVAGFFSETRTLALSWSALIVLTALLFIIYPQYLSLMSFIKFGFKDNILRLLISSVTAGLLGGVIGYALIQMRIMFQHKREGL